MDLYPLSFQNDLKKLLAILFLFASTSEATTNQIDFNFGRGYPLSAIVAGDASDRDGSRGTDWSIDALHKIGNQFYLGIGSGQFDSNDNASYTFVPGIDTRISSKVTSTFLLGRMDLLPSSKYVLYGIIGVGWVKETLTINSTPLTAWSDTGTSEGRTVLDDSSNALGFLGGIGLDYSLTDMLFIGVEARYQGSEKKNFSLSPEGDVLLDQPSINVPVNFYILGLKAGIKY